MTNIKYSWVFVVSRLDGQFGLHIQVVMPECGLIIQHDWLPINIIWTAQNEGWPPRFSWTTISRGLLCGQWYLSDRRYEERIMAFLIAEMERSIAHSFSQYLNIYSGNNINPNPNS